LDCGGNPESFWARRVGVFVRSRKALPPLRLKPPDTDETDNQNPELAAARNRGACGGGGFHR
jgi:hypothetical protein